MKRTMAIALAALLLATGLIACGGSDSEDDSEAASFEDAQVEFAQCMREEGIDMPDPSGDGPAPLEGIDPGSEEFQSASEACGSIIEDAVPEGELPDQAEMQDQILELTQCLRDKGFDVEDPQIGAGGGGFQGPPDDVQDLMDDPEFQAAQDECQDETGVEIGPPGGA